MAGGSNRSGRLPVDLRRMVFSWSGYVWQQDAVSSRAHLTAK